MAQVVKVLAIWAPVLSQQPLFPSSQWPGKAVEDSPKLWDPAPAWETLKRLLALDRHSIGHCAHFGSESLDGRASSLSLLSVYPPFQWKINQIFKKKIMTTLHVGVLRFECMLWIYLLAMTYSGQADPVFKILAGGPLTEISSWCSTLASSGMAVT